MATISIFLAVLTALYILRRIYSRPLLKDFDINSYIVFNYPLINPQMPSSPVYTGFTAFFILGETHVYP